MGSWQREGAGFPVPAMVISKVTELVLRRLRFEEFILALYRDESGFRCRPGVSYMLGKLILDKEEEEEGRG